MKSYPLQKIDAFTTGKSSGNPAACVTLNSQDDIRPEMMQQIAFELKDFVSEVGFVWPSQEADFDLRYFSSEQEVSFCGHATIAILHRLISTSPELIDKKELLIRTRHSSLKVINRVKDENLVYIHTPKPQFVPIAFNHCDIAEALDLPLNGLDQTQPPVLINLGQNILLVKLSDKQTCLDCQPDFVKLRQFCLENSFDILTLYVQDKDFPDVPLSTRVFPPVYGYLEDRATGSGNAALGYHLLACKQWDGALTTIEQGKEADNPNLVHLKSIDGLVLIGGSAVCRIEGNYFLHGE